MVLTNALEKSARHATKKFVEHFGHDEVFVLNAYVGIGLEDDRLFAIHRFAASAANDLKRSRCVDDLEWLRRHLGFEKRAKALDDYLALKVPGHREHDVTSFDECAVVRSKVFHRERFKILNATV